MTQARKERRLRTALLAAALVLAAAAVVAFAPYWWPVGWGLPPCGRDWTSPTSYLPRPSPTRVARFSLAGAGGERVDGKICYGSPSARGREIFGALVPWGELWRTGANEPTRLFVDAPVTVAGIALERGRYSLYTRPGQESWDLFVSRSTFHWGNAIDSGVRAQEVGSATLFPQPLETPVEALRFRVSGAGPSQVELRLEWDRTALPIPVQAR